MTLWDDDEFYNQEHESNSMRSLGCTDCSRSFGKNSPFVHHMTDGGFGGPWCIQCAVTKFGFGEPDPNKNFHFHDVGEP